MSDSDMEKNIKHEVKKLLKMEPKDITKIYNAIEKLSEKYDSEVTNTIYSAFATRRKKLLSKAEKINEKINKKYPNLTQREVEAKVKSYQKNYHFDDDEYKIIMRIINDGRKYQIHSKEIRDILPFTPISRALGFIPQGMQYSTGEMRVDSKEMDSLNKIIELDAASKKILQLVTLQSITYKDCDPCIMEADYRPGDYDVQSHADPILVAMFIPKFDILEKKMLMTSLSHILVSRKNGEPLRTEQEIEIFEDWCRDPVETQCSVENKPFNDLLSRCRLQVALWTNVLKIRQGKFYYPEALDFISVCDMCKNTLYDAPDFMYVKDSGTFVRKIFGSFSFRPTIVRVNPIEQYMGINQLSNDPFNTQNMIPFDSNIPMIFVRLPDYKDDTVEVPMNSVIKSKQTFPKGRQIIVRENEVIHSDGILVFYISRRCSKNNFIRRTRRSQSIMLPMQNTLLEKLNETIFKAQPVLGIGSENYTLVSAVCIEVLDGSDLNNNLNIAEPGEKLIVGTCALIRDLTKPGDNENYIYDPLNDKCTETNFNKNPEPIMHINLDDYKEYLEKQGTLYFYRSDSSLNGTNSIINAFAP